MHPKAEIPAKLYQMTSKYAKENQLMNTVGNNGIVNGGCSDPLTLAPCVNSPLRGAGKPQIAEERSFITGKINRIF